MRGKMGAQKRSNLVIQRISPSSALIAAVWPAIYNSQYPSVLLHFSVYKVGFTYQSIMTPLDCRFLQRQFIDNCDISHVKSSLTGCSLLRHPPMVPCTSRIFSCETKMEQLGSRVKILQMSLEAWFQSQNFKLTIQNKATQMLEWLKVWIAS